MQQTLKRLIQTAVCLAFALGFMAQAADEKKIDVTGAWKSSFTNQNGDVRETIVTLKAEGEKLTGTISGRNADTPIENGKITGEEISFQVKRDRGGATVVTKYSGKVSGDTITGKTETDRDGQAQSRDWVAKRAPAKAP